ncbi:MAG: hypothetical protein EON54_22960 [Alcaligenaceae bacterium]|nr:MAG: hypothetical protein EON54_22960 [Alcaligenaceae bacterium]
MRLITLLCLAALAAGCSKPTATVIPTDMSKWDTDLAPAMQKLNDEDRQLATGYLMRAKLGEAFGGKGLPPGTTIADALANQRQFIAQREAADAEARALAERVKKERAALAEQINAAVTVTLVEKSQLPRDYGQRRMSDQQIFRVAVLNKSSTEVIGVAGELQFLDVFGKQVAATSFTISEHIKPSQVFNWIGSRDYNQFIDSHKTLWNLEEGKYTTRFVPEGIVFADGRKLVAQN